MPRRLDDGAKNAFEIVRLKPKLGNLSNATCEMELRGALAWRVGPEDAAPPPSSTWSP